MFAVIDDVIDDVVDIVVGVRDVLGVLLVCYRWCPRCIERIQHYFKRTCIGEPLWTLNTTAPLSAKNTGLCSQALLSHSIWLARKSNRKRIFCWSDAAAKWQQSFLNSKLAIDLGTSCSICSGSWLIIVMVPKTHRKLWNTSSVVRMILYHLYLTKTLLSLLWLSLWWSAYTHPPNLLHKCCAGARESGNKETLVPRVLPPSKNVHMNACLGVIYKWLLDSTSNAHSVSQNEWLIIFVHVRNAIPL